MCTVPSSDDFKSVLLRRLHHRDRVILHLNEKAQSVSPPGERSLLSKVL
jgi:hypothetical protein